MKMEQAKMNIAVTDLNEVIADVNHIYEGTVKELEIISNSDIANVKDTAIRFFLYHVNFIKNVEYDTNTSANHIQNEMLKNSRYTFQMTNEMNILPLIECSQNEIYSRSLAKESSSQTTSEDFGSTITSFFNSLFGGDNETKDLSKESTDIVEYLRKAFVGDRKGTIELLFNITALAKTHQNRIKAAEYFEKLTIGNSSKRTLDIDAFFCLKEIIFCLLNVCLEKKDVLNALRLIKSTQAYKASYTDNSETTFKSMSSFIYTHNIVKSKRFWIVAIAEYIKVELTLNNRQSKVS